MLRCRMASDSGRDGEALYAALKEDALLSDTMKEGEYVVVGPNPLSSWSWRDQNFWDLILCTAKHRAKSLCQSSFRLLLPTGVPEE